MLTDPGELHSAELGEDPFSADRGLQQYSAGMVLCHCADPRCLSGSGDRPHGLQECIGASGIADNEHPSLTGAVERVQPEHVACCLDCRLHRDRCLFQFDGKRHVFRELIEGGGDTAPRGIAQDSDRTGRRAVQQSVRDAVKGTAVGLQGTVFPKQAGSRHHDCSTVTSHAAADKDSVSGAYS